MKRGRLYACARREGYNVLAMGQHLDDLAERCVVENIAYDTRLYTLLNRLDFWFSLMQGGDLAQFCSKEYTIEERRRFKL